MLSRLKILGSCANRQLCWYTEKDVEQIFSAIEHRVKQVRTKFHFGKNNSFKP